MLSRARFALSARPRPSAAPVPPGGAGALRRGVTLARACVRDASGGALVATVLLFVALALCVGLVADVGRTHAERARLQIWLDGVALAAAAQLDGRDDALIRARWAAAEAMPPASGLFSAVAAEPGGAPAGEVGSGFSLAGLRFLSDLPEGGLAGGDPAGLFTEDPALARYALAEAAPRGVSWTVLNFLVSAPEDGGAFAFAARAVAAPIPRPGCGAPILAVCMAPDADPTAPLGRPGAQLRLRRAGLDAAPWEPGDYAPLGDIGDDDAGSCAGFEGDARLACLLAIAAPSNLCPLRVTPVAAPSVLVSGPLNIRFDRWGPGTEALRGAPAAAAMPADVDVLAGEAADCRGRPLSGALASHPLPDDPCFHRGDCAWSAPPPSGAALMLYQALTHGTGLPPGAATRRDLYAHEVLSGLLEPAGIESSAAPICNPLSPPRPGRREIRVAAVDCAGLGPEGGVEVESAAQVRALITRPVPHHDAFVATFDGDHQGHPIRVGDVPSQDLGPGNPGNHKDVGRAGETPNGDPDWGCGDKGRSDAEEETCAGTVWPESDLRVTDARGRVTYDPYRAQGLMRIEVRQARAANAPAWKNVPMIFDSAAPSGGDPDLASTGFGHVLIVSEDGDAGDPDDAARGGWLLFHFDRPTRVDSLRVIDSERGGGIRLYDAIRTAPEGEFATGAAGALVPLRAGEAHDAREVARAAIPILGDGRHAVVALGVEGVRTLAVFLPESGAVDDLVFANDLARPNIDERLMLEVVETIPAPAALTAVLVE